MSDPEQPAAPQVLPEAPPPAEAAAAAAQPPPPDVVAAPVITLETPPMLSGPKSGDKRSAEDAAEGDAKRAAAECECCWVFLWCTVCVCARARASQRGADTL